MIELNASVQLVCASHMLVTTAFSSRACDCLHCSLRLFDLYILTCQWDPFCCLTPYFGSDFTT